MRARLALLALGPIVILLNESMVLPFVDQTTNEQQVPRCVHLVGLDGLDRCSISAPCISCSGPSKASLPEPVEVILDAGIGATRGSFVSSDATAQTLMQETRRQ